MSDELTEKDIKNMEEEIEYLKVVVRQRLLEDVKTARALGDLSENFEYYAAKKAKNKNESRIRYLERMVRTARIIKDTSDADEVGVDKTVTVRMEATGKEMKFSVVTAIRGDSLSNRITMASPLGKALRGHKAGEKVRVTVSPECSYEVSILNVEPMNV